MPILYSDRVSVMNLKILGYRANSDGIDIYSSRDVAVQGCFIRTVDDLITVKSKARNANAVTDSDKVKQCGRAGESPVERNRHFDGNWNCSGGRHQRCHV